jgi:hypothetical protein
MDTNSNDPLFRKEHEYIDISLEELIQRIQDFIHKDAIIRMTVSQKAYNTDGTEYSVKDAFSDQHLEFNDRNPVSYNISIMIEADDIMKISN